MKLVTFEKNDQCKIGALVDEVIVDIRVTAEAQQQSGSTRIFNDMLALLDGGAEGMQRAAEAVDFALGSEQKDKLTVALDQVKLLAPIPRPRTIFCLAENYTEHFEEGGKIFKEKDKITPKVFMKPCANTTIGPGEPIILPEIARAIDWEAELAVVIGRKGKHVSRADAFDYVAGYTAFNDVSERDFQIKKRPESSEWDSYFDWLNGKWFDSFAPMGPCLVTRDEIDDPHRLNLSLSINGKLWQDDSTKKMIHRIDEIIEYISTFMTLHPGDVIATGTPAGTGEPHGIFLKPGDTIRIEIEKIGVLENRVEAE